LALEIVSAKAAFKEEQAKLHAQLKDQQEHFSMQLQQGNANHVPSLPRSSGSGSTGAQQTGDGESRSLSRVGDQKPHAGTKEQQVLFYDQLNHANGPDVAAHSSSHIDLATLEARLQSLSSGASVRGSGYTALSVPSPKHDSTAVSIDKGTLLATMLLEQAREGRIHVDAVHLQALRISLDGAPSAPDLPTMHAIHEEAALQLQRQLDHAVSELHSRELKWQIAEALLKDQLSKLSSDLDSSQVARAAAETRVLDLVADFAERDVKSAREAEVEIQAAKQSCEARVLQVGEDSAAALKSADEAAAAAIAAAREECDIQLQAARDAYHALEQRCATFSIHLSSEQSAARVAHADHERAAASLRMERDNIAAALSAARSDNSNFVSALAMLKIELSEKDMVLRDSQTDIVKMRDVVAQAIRDKTTAENNAEFLQERLREATESIKFYESAEKKQMDARSALQDVSFKMAGLEVRAQQLSQELQAAVSELCEARSQGAACFEERDKIASELVLLKEKSLDQNTRHESDIQHLKSHLRETAAGRVAAEDEVNRLKKEVSSLQLKIDGLTARLEEQQKDAVAGAEETRTLHLNALQFVKEQHNHQAQLIADQHAQQKQLWLHTEKELRDKILERKIATAAALASADIQKKALEAEAAVLRQEKSQLEEQVHWLCASALFLFE
jgi:hypothetical protein